MRGNVCQAWDVWQAWEKVLLPHSHQELCHSSAFAGAFCGMSLVTSQAGLRSQIHRYFIFPSPWLACSTVHPWFVCSITVSLAHLLHRVLPSLLAPSLHLLFFLERQR